MEEFLAIGSEGEKVRQLQEQLKAREYDIKADGIYGEETRAAVIRFQESKGLKPDGIVSPETASRLGMEEFLAIGIDLSEGSSYEVSCPLAKTAHEVAKLIVSTPKSTPKPKPKPK